MSCCLKNLTVSTPIRYRYARPVCSDIVFRSSVSCLALPLKEFSSDSQVVEVIAAAIGLSSAGVVAGKYSGLCGVRLWVIYYFAPDVKERHSYWITPGLQQQVVILKSCLWSACRPADYWVASSPADV